jgi:hypothetical protein
MRTRIFLALAATALVAYSGTAAADPTCANRADLKLTVKKYHIDLNDKRPVCVEVGEEFEIQIVNPHDGGHDVEQGHVTVQQKTDEKKAVMIIDGKNDSAIKRMTVSVNLASGMTEKDYKVGDEFSFWIRIEGVGTLDPRIRVIGDGSGGAE